MKQFFSSQKLKSRELHRAMGKIAKMPKRFGKAIKHSCSQKVSQNLTKRKTRLKQTKETIFSHCDYNFCSCLSKNLYCLLKILDKSYCLTKALDQLNHRSKTNLTKVALINILFQKLVWSIPSQAFFLVQEVYPKRTSLFAFLCHVQVVPNEYSCFLACPEARFLRVF